MRAGAFGFTTSRTNAHKTTRGEMVPGRFAEIEELTGIGGALGTVGVGTFGMNSDFEDEAAEFEWITRLGKETGRPVWFLLTDRPTDPERWRRIMAGVHQARAEGARGHGTGRRAPGRRHSRHRDLAEPVLDPRALQAVREPAAWPSAWRGCAIRRCAGRSSPIRRRRRC